MSNKIHEIKGYSIVASKVAFITRIFEANEDEGYQFNIAFLGDLRISVRFPTRHDAELERELLLKSIRAS
jgi:hypothetical protein